MVKENNYGGTFFLVHMLIAYNILACIGRLNMIRRYVQYIHLLNMLECFELDISSTAARSVANEISSWKLSIIYC